MPEAERFKNQDPSFKEGSRRKVQGEVVTLRIDGRPVSVPAGTVVAAAIARAGSLRFRRSVSGEQRGPLCGMGTCMECRVTINGQPHRRSCQTPCEPGMEVQTDA